MRTFQGNNGKAPTTMTIQAGRKRDGSITWKLPPTHRLPPRAADCPTGQLGRLRDKLQWRSSHARWMLSGQCRPPSQITTTWAWTLPLCTLGILFLGWATKRLLHRDPVNMTWDTLLPDLVQLASHGSVIAHSYGNSPQGQPDESTCPEIKRGARGFWTVYVLLILFSLPRVLLNCYSIN